MTQAQAEAALQHAISIVLDHPEDGPMVKALAHGGITRIHDLICLRPTDIDALTYPNVYGSTSIKLSASHCYQLQVLVLFYHACHTHISGNTWNTITKDGYQSYCISHGYYDAMVADVVPAPVLTPKP